MIVKMKMNKNRNESLKRILTERKREILREIQDKIRDVRAEAEWKDEEIPERRLRALPFAIRCKDCEEALEVAEERVGDRPLDGWFVLEFPW